MSEPMTTVEIEDVLASIRRLVSEDLRAAASRSAETARSHAAAPGKLILTPALRVPADAQPDEAEDLVHPAMDSTAEGPTLGSVVARVGAQVGEDVGREEWEAEAPYEEADWDAPAWEGEAAPPAEESSVVPFVLMQERRMQAAWRDGAWADQPERGGAGAPVVPLPEDRIARPAVEAPFEPEVRADEMLTDLSDVAVEAVPAEIMPEVDSFHSRRSTLGLGVDFIEMAPPAPEAEEAEPEDVAAAPLAEADPADDLAETVVMAGMAEAEEEVMARVIDEAPQVFAPGDADDFDEEALREVVRDILREELQGALGERITRSVRKLVRAEIQRMLIARDMS